MDEIKEEVLVGLVGEERYKSFLSLGACIDGSILRKGNGMGAVKNGTMNINAVWGGKTLCAFYFRKDCLGFMVILGKAEQAAFEQSRLGFSEQTQSIYEASKAYHDGRWLMLTVDDESLKEDIIALLALKRRPTNY